MRTILLMPVLTGLAAGALNAQSIERATGWTPVLQIRAVASSPEGEGVRATIDWKLLKDGEPLGDWIWTERTLCTIGIGGSAGAMSDPARRNVWKVSGQYLGEEAGRHQVRVTSRFVRLAGAEANAANTQTLSLREGDTVVLDALIDRPDAACPVRVITFEARLAMQAADPALARARFAADLWLVHRDPAGREQREHLVTNVSAGGPAMPFMFNPLSFSIPQLDPRQGNAEAAIRVSGSIQVRPRANGAVSIDLDVNRPLFVLDNPDKPETPPVGPLRMTLTVRNGETAAVDFPAPSSGFASLPLATGSTPVRVVPGRPSATSAGQPTDAVQVKNDKLILYTFQFFKNHQTRLLITLKPLE